MLERVWQLRDNLSAYDAGYVALAENLRPPYRGRSAESRSRSRVGDHDRPALMFDQLDQILLIGRLLG
ncbi:MAG: hypothetical protein ACR2LI_10520 [Propionibacteriaceae bacterium]